MCLIYNTATIISQKSVQFVQHYASPHHLALAKKTGINIPSGTQHTAKEPLNATLPPRSIT